MTIETLRELLRRNPNVKLYVSGDGFCMCAKVHSPRSDQEGMRLVTGATVRVTFPSMAITTERFGPGVLWLTGKEKFTRRLQTHRRHLLHLDVPEQYFRAAELL